MRADPASRAATEQVFGPFMTVHTFESDEEALRLDPHFAKARYNRGNARLGLGYYAEALEDCEKAAAVTVPADEKAMMRALKKKLIAGAGLDVFEHEPKLPPALRTMKNVVLTPHLGSAVMEIRDQMANIVVDNIQALIDGRTPPNCVNPQVLAQS